MILELLAATGPVTEAARSGAETALVPIAVALVSGPVAAIGVAYVTHRHNARKVPAETDSIAVGSSEKAVLSLERALQRANEEIDRERTEHAAQIDELRESHNDEVGMLRGHLRRLEREADDDAAKIMRLQSEVRVLRDRLAEVEQDAQRVQNELSQIGRRTARRDEDKE